ncbi:MAG TPA: hypothetical protein DCP64_02200, partial [Sarcina sp.]|nr:hypothetical protein [Sarcina sp.]
GGPYSDGRISTYSFFLRHEDTQERAEYLKDQYGTGGRSHALSGADDSYADYSAKGIVLTRGEAENSAVLRMSYTQAAHRIDHLIGNDSFLTAQDHVRMPAYEREQLAAGVIRFYSTLTPVSDWPFKGSIFDMETRKEIALMIEDPEKLHDLLEKMDARFASVPETDPRYQMRLDALTDLHSYAEGTFTLFPQPRQEIVTPPSTQLSLADLFEMNVPEEAQHSGPEVEVEDNTVTGPADITAENSGSETMDGTLSPGSGEMGISGSDEQEQSPDIPRQDISNEFSSWAEADMRQDTLQPLSGPAAAEYNGLKNRYPEALVGFEQNGFYEFYGEDARR